MAEEQRQRLIFMGTPAFAATILEKLLKTEEFDIVGVFCGPDKRLGRGMKLAACETKKLALCYNLPIFQPVSLKNPEIVNAIGNSKPDFLVVAAYGMLIPQEILDIPVKAALNVHASLLPAYRGAAPIQRAIMENGQGTGKTGISIMKVVKALDAGPVYAQAEIAIGRHDRPSLERELAVLGADLLVDTLRELAADKVQALEQDEDKVTWAPKLEKRDGLIDWRKTVAEVDALVRGVTPWPGARTSFMLLGRDGTIPVILTPGEPGEKEENLQPGQIARVKNGLRIACADGWYIPGSVHPEGGREMGAADFANGYCKVKTGLCGLAVNAK